MPTQTNLSPEAREALDEAIRDGWRVMTREFPGDDLKFRRVYRDSDGYYFRCHKGRTARRNIVSARCPFGDWVYTGDYAPRFK